MILKIKDMYFTFEAYNDNIVLPFYLATYGIGVADVTLFLMQKSANIIVRKDMGKRKGQANLPSKLVHSCDFQPFIL